MSGRDLDALIPPTTDSFLAVEVPGVRPDSATSTLRSLMESRSITPPSTPIVGVLVGELLALADEGRTPLILHPGAPTAAVRARSTIDLHAAHIGNPLVLMFENGDPLCPIVIGVLRDGEGTRIESTPGQLEVDADGERLLVTATKQLVLRCGKASITLTAAGKVLIEGNYISSHSSGVNRVKGASVQIN